LWQFGPNKKFDAADFSRFLELLPAKAGGIKLRHALEVRHPSFHTAEFLALARSHNAAVVYPDTDEYPASADLTADFVYARLMKAQSKIKTGYSSKAIKEWGARAQTWAQGGEPAGLSHIEKKRPSKKSRDVFVFFINGAKERAPAAAADFLRILGSL
jgi:uncharacterized protein YecE (DUF72 family)